MCGKEFPRKSYKSSVCSIKCSVNRTYQRRTRPHKVKRMSESNGVAITQTETFGTDMVLKQKSRLLGDGKTASKKHVNNDMLVSEFPAHNKGLNDGTGKSSVSLEFDLHPKQVIASQAVEAGAKIVLFSAGIRSGKSMWLVRELIKQPYVYDVVPNLMFMVAPTNGMMPTPRRLFTNAAGDALVTEKRASDAGPAHFLMKPTKSIPKHYFIIEMHSGEHPDRMRGPTIAGAGIDEAQLTKPEVMDILRGRVMESGGVILMAATATYPGHWTVTEIKSRAYRCGKCRVCVYDHYDLAKGADGEPERDPLTGKQTRRYVPKDHDPVDCYGDPRVAVITCSSFDNTFLSREQVEQLERDYALKDPIIARRELYAEDVGFEGIAYSRFDRNQHLSHFTVHTVPSDAYICCGLDFGANDPCVCVIGAKIGDTWHIIGEYYSDDRSRTLKDHVDGIKRACGPVWSRVRSYWHDPSGRIAAMEMSRYGLRPMKAARKRTATGQRWLVYRYEVVNSLILGRSQDDRPLLRVNTAVCKGLLHDLENRKWKRHKSEGEDGQTRVVDAKGRQVDRNAGDDFASGDDHGTDALEYMIVSEFVKGIYKPKGKGQKQVGDDVQVEATEKLSREEANIGLAVSGNIQNIVKAMRKPGRNRAGW